MATKTITELQAAATPILSTDLMIVSRDGYNLTKTTAAQLPVSSAVQTALDTKVTGGYDVDGKLTSLKNKDGTDASIGGGGGSGNVIVGSSAPNNADGLPDGTIYIQVV